MTLPREQGIFPYNPECFKSNTFSSNANPSNFMNNPYNIYYLQMQQQQLQNRNVINPNFPENRFQTPNYSNTMIPSVNQQPILQTNYINNVNIYSNFTPLAHQSNILPPKYKSNESPLLTHEKSNVNEDDTLKTNLPTTSQISPDIYNRIVSNQEYHPYIPSSGKVKGHAPTISELYDSTCFLNTNITSSHDASSKEKKSSSIDDLFNIQKRIERMSLNENYNLNDLMQNNEFVNYVYNYRFSVNDKEEISNQIFKFSQNQQRAESIGQENQISADKSKDQLETEETEQDESSSPFNYNSYYNSLFGNTNHSTD